jgi:hypothetical protein
MKQNYCPVPERNIKVVAIVVNLVHPGSFAENDRGEPAKQSLC